MPLLRFRIDPTQRDAVWLETPDGDRVMAYWGPEFMFVAEPEPAVVNAAGVVVAVNGRQINPDDDLHGHALCPAGPILFIGP
jgi:hypothetical protein